MKNLALSISITFEEGNSELAFKILQDLHEDGIYLENISSNHPMAKLYEWVDADKYWNYIYNLCTQPQLSAVVQPEVPEKKNKKKSKKQQEKEQ